MTKANNVLKLRPLRHEDREWLNQYLTIQCRFPLQFLQVSQVAPSLL